MLLISTGSAYLCATVDIVASLILTAGLLYMSVAGYGACFMFTLIDDAAAIFETNLQPWITSFFSLSLTTNLLATCEYSVV